MKNQTHQECPMHWKVVSAGPCVSGDARRRVNIGSGSEISCASRQMARKARHDRFDRTRTDATILSDRKMSPNLTPSGKDTGCEVRK